MRRRWKLYLLIAVALYLGGSWLAFVFPPRIELGSGVPVEAVSALTEFCDNDDYLWRYHWGIPASVFWSEPLTHRELRLKRIVLERETDARIRATCLSTEQAVWFDLRDGAWRLDHSTILTF